MPKAFAIFIDMIVGYLNGAGLGALSLEFLSNRIDSQPQTALLALLVVGPLGAFFSLLIAAGKKEEAETPQGA